MSFLLLILLFILFVFFALISLGASFLRLLFRRPYSPFGKQTNNTHSYKNDTDSTHESSHSKSHKKVFKKEEGEYVDFEEIK